jgi:phosphatidylinositol alpha-mannosyltransferase
MLDERNVDVVHFHEPFAPLLGYSELLASSRPHVGTFHRSGGGPAYTLTKPLLRRLLAGLSARVAVSDAAAETLRQATGAEATVLFNGFEIERFVSGERPDRPNILFIGRAEERKGLGILLAAHAAHCDEFDVTLVGSGTVEAWVKSGRPKGVTALGPVSDEHKRRLLSTASALVAPSIFGESFGLIVIEAMASGTPVVASDIDGYRKAAGGCASMFTPGSAEDLSRAIRVALASDVVARQRGRERAEQFSMSTLMDQYVHIYEQVIEQHHRG